MNIKAIETEYKGYRFRSRLEARWAVFFDGCKLKWEYEPEGIVIDGVPYLPDFRIDQICEDGVRSAWVEIKRKNWDDENDCADRLKNLSAWKHQPALLMRGDPYDCFNAPIQKNEPSPILMFIDGDTIEDPKIEAMIALGIVPYDRAMENDDGTPGPRFDTAGIIGFCLCLVHGKKARSARFEFGEKG